MPPVSVSVGLGLSVIAVPVGVGVPPPLGEIDGLDGDDEPVGDDVGPPGEDGLLDEDGDVECDLEQRTEPSWFFAPECSVVSDWLGAMMSFPFTPADSVGLEPVGGI